MKSQLHNSPDIRTWVETDQSKVVVHSEIEDQPNVQSAQNLKSFGVKSGKNQAPVHPDGANVAYWFHANEHLWRLFFKKHPDIRRAYYSHDQLSREKAAAIIAKMHPEWVVVSPQTARVHAQSKPCSTGGDDA